MFTVHDIWKSGDQLIMNKSGEFTELKAKKSDLVEWIQDAPLENVLISKEFHQGGSKFDSGFVG